MTINLDVPWFVSLFRSGLEFMLKNVIRLLVILNWITGSRVLGAASSLQSDVLLLVVDKRSLEAELRTWPEDPSLSKKLLSFQVAIGKAIGDKQRQGDHKTPEGIYITQDILEGRRLPIKYGASAIPIDFPNPMDRLSHKTGYGIWLHGVENNSRVKEAMVTEGCVAFYNEDILTLTGMMMPHQGIVMITNNPANVNQAHHISEVRTATQTWLRAWKSRRINSYSNAYAKEFRYKDRSKTSYIRYKKRVFTKYKDMEINTRDLRIFSHEKYAMAIMNQDFKGDRYVSNGRKILYWQKKSDGWKIVREVFEERRLNFTAFSPEKLARVGLYSPSRKQDFPQSNSAVVPL